MEVNGVEAEKWASERVRDKEELSWKKWAQRVNDVLATFDRLLQPDLIVSFGFWILSYLSPPWLLVVSPYLMMI